MKKALVLSALFLFSSTVFCQNSDSLATVNQVDSLIRISRTLTNKGDFDKALEANAAAEKLAMEKFGRQSVAYGNCCHNHGRVFHFKGEYPEAEKWYLESKAIRENLLGKEHPDYALSLNNLAGIYYEMGDYKKAEPLFLESKAIREKTQGKEHPNYAGSLNNLANLYSDMGFYEKAEAFYIESIAIKEKTLGKEHSDYAWGLHNLATLYEDLDNYKKAETLYLEALAIREKTLGKEHPDYGANLNSLANLYSDMGDYKKAEPLYLESKAIREKTLGKEHHTYTRNLQGLIASYWLAGNFDATGSYLSEAVTIEKKLLLRASRHLSEQELSKYIGQFTISQKGEFSFAHVREDITTDCYDNTLFYKGFLLNAVTQIGKLALTDSVSEEKCQLFKSYQRRLAAEYSKPVAERDSAKVADLEQRANTLEKELASKVPGFGEALLQVNWREVQAALEPGEAAIEFVHYKFVNPYQTDSVMYAALILQIDTEKPVFIPLVEEKQLDTLLRTSGERKADYASKLYSIAGRGLEESRQSLYDLVWKPIEKELLLAEGAKANAEIKTIFYAPSGLLHRLNLSAIPINPDSTLADKYQLVQLGSTRQMVIPTGRKGGNNDALLFGGIRYEMDSTAIRQTANAATTEPALAGNRGILSFAYADSLLRSGSAWNYLPYTDKEVVAVEQIMKSGGLVTQLQKGYAATEESFKRIGQNGVPSPRVLHIATHGFFFPDPASTGASKGAELRHNFRGEAEPVFKISEHPMIRSGLLFAGANHAWKTGKPFSPDIEDGILTAYEISQMNLSNTELVVLSACETGLGQVHGNEGVYGLQRAFKIAGVKYLIMSLWQVPDRQTSLLMTTFYKKWLEDKMEIPEAFRAAQKEMREQGFDPYHWAGFVLVE